MADVQNIITDGIGSAPGNIRYFILSGLDVNPGATVTVDWTLQPRDTTWTLPGRDTAWTLQPRDLIWTLKDER